ncbi:MAG: hypothetical protein IJG70_08975, partial [Kiritimatiellae bacterium]|nr:hypothetical protein [Kiritimatiellia bacterium]
NLGFASFSPSSDMFSAASVYVLHRGFVPRPHTNHKTSLKRGFAIASSFSFSLQLTYCVKKENTDSITCSG